ncbi:MAG: DUF58 domain-containing protein [Clostridia bacterium]|nr:DUF58 domain-containing protein [Clostridia bacterium]
MTARGILCLLLDACLLVLALGSGIRELLVAAFCLSAFIAFAFLSLLLARFTLRVCGGLQQPFCTRGEEVLYTLSLRGFLLFPITGHLSMLPPGADIYMQQNCRYHAFSLLPTWRVKREFSFTLSSPHRGNWAVKPRTLQLQDLFGLFRVSLLRGSMGRAVSQPITVLPRQHELEQVREELVVPEGFAAAQLRDAIDGELLGDTHLYQQGESLKRIHWKQSARMQTLYTRQFEAQEDARVLVLMDVGCASMRRADAGDMAAESALSLAAAYVALRQTVRLLPVGGEKAKDDGFLLRQLREVEQLADQMAVWPCRRRTDPLEMWQLPENSLSAAATIHVITDNPSQELMESLSVLQKQGRLVGLTVVQPDPLPTEAVRGMWQEGLLTSTVIHTVDDIAGKVGAVG